MPPLIRVQGNLPLCRSTLRAPSTRSQLSASNSWVPPPLPLSMLGALIWFSPYRRVRRAFEYSCINCNGHHRARFRLWASRVDPPPLHCHRLNRATMPLRLRVRPHLRLPPLLRQLRPHALSALRIKNKRVRPGLNPSKWRCFCWYPLPRSYVCLPPRGSSSVFSIISNNNRTFDAARFRSLIASFTSIPVAQVLLFDVVRSPNVSYSLVFVSTATDAASHTAAQDSFIALVRANSSRLVPLSIISCRLNGAELVPSKSVGMKLLY